MALTQAERNRRKRERKKKEREQRKKEEEADEKSQDVKEEPNIEIEYVAEPVAAPEAHEALRRFQEITSAVVSDEEKNDIEISASNEDDQGEGNELSKRKLRDKLRPSVAELKRRVRRPDLVEAHDVTATDPDFLIELKAMPGTVQVPRHWGRKRKYLQGKRGYEKRPFELPEFLLQTGIAEVRDKLAEDESGMSAKQKNRMRVNPKMGAVDVDYKVLHDAFFKHQTKPKNLTKFGDLYYEGKELEVRTNVKPGGPLSKQLREALGMTSETSPPPWLLNMQRYGPPPSYPSLRIPGLNAPLPSPECQYGYHPGGWGKPPVDQYQRPLYGGNPFDPPGSDKHKETIEGGLVTSDGKAIAKAEWGALPTGYLEDEESEEEESSASEMEESESEEEEEAAPLADGMESVLPPPMSIPSATAPMDLRKQAGDETPMPDSQPKQLYQVIEQKSASVDQQKGAVFASEVAYAVPGEKVPEGAESVLSKARPQNDSRKKKKDEDEEELGKNFKF